MVLVTGDAHGLCARCGFTPLAAPQRHVERHRPEACAAAAGVRGGLQHTPASANED